LITSWLRQSRLFVARAGQKCFYVRIRLEIWAGEEPVLTHDYAAEDRDVLIQFPVGTLGDTLGWFP